MYLLKTSFFYSLPIYIYVSPLLSWICQKPIITFILYYISYYIFQPHILDIKKDYIIYQNASLETSIVMVLILDGNSEIGAHVRGNLCYYLFKAFDLHQELSQNFFSPKRPIFLHAFAQYVLSYHLKHHGNINSNLL